MFCIETLHKVSQPSHLLIKLNIMYIIQISEVTVIGHQVSSFRMFVFVTQINSKLGHVGSKTRLPCQLKGKAYKQYNVFMSNPLSLKPGHVGSNAGSPGQIKCQ